MINKKWIAIALTLTTGCAAKKQQAPASVVHIGALVDQTSTLAVPSWAASIRLAEQVLNQGLTQAGGLKNMQLKFDIVTLDPDDTVNVQAYQSLITQQNIKAILLDLSHTSLAIDVLQYSSNATMHPSLPILSAGTSPSFNNPNTVNSDPTKQAAYRDADDWFFRMGLSDLSEGNATTSFILASAGAGDVNHDGKLKVNLYASNEPYGLGTSSYLKTHILAQRPDAFVGIVTGPGTNFTSYSGYPGDIQNLTQGTNDGSNAPQVPPDFIIDPFLDPSTFTKLYIQGSNTVRLLNAHGFLSVNELQQLGDGANGQEGFGQSTVYGLSGPQFSSLLLTATSLPPAFRDAIHFDAAMVAGLSAIYAVQNNNLVDPTQVTGTQVRDAFRKINDKTAGAAGTIRVTADDVSRAVQMISTGQPIDYDGASGPMDFDAVGDVQGYISHYKVVQNHFTEDQTYDCVVSSLCPLKQQ